MLSQRSSAPLSSVLCYRESSSQAAVSFKAGVLQSLLPAGALPPRGRCAVFKWLCLPFAGKEVREGDVSHKLRGYASVPQLGREDGPIDACVLLMGAEFANAQGVGGTRDGVGAADAAPSCASASAFL